MLGVRCGDGCGTGLVAGAVCVPLGALCSVCVPFLGWKNKQGSGFSAVSLQLTNRAHHSPVLLTVSEVTARIPQPAGALGRGDDQILLFFFPLQLTQVSMPVPCGSVERRHV